MRAQSPTIASDVTIERNLELAEQKKVTKISAFHIIIIFAIKLIVSLFSKSLSFFSELTDSILDFAALFITYVGLKESRKDPDYQHMFGHYKISSAAGLIQSLLTVGMYFYIFYTSLMTLYLSLTSKIPYTTVNPLLQVIILLIILGIVFFDSTIIIRIGKKQNNTLIMAQGQNFRGDFYRNISFIIGLLFAAFGFALLDPILAIIFSVRSIFNGSKTLKQSFNELIDANTINQEDLEAVEQEIKSLPDVQNLDHFSVRTHGIHLDARIMVKIDAQYSVFGGNIIADQIRRIMNQKFSPRFKCNVLVQFNLASEANILNLDYVYELVRDLGMKNHSLQNIHNISIDEFQDKILVLYHIDLDPMMSIEEGHKIANFLEHSINAAIKSKIGEKKEIQTTCHIEPITQIKKVHSHSTKRAVPDLLYTRLNDIISQIPQVKGIKELIIQPESEGLYLIVKLYLDPKTSIMETHEVTDRVEYKIRSKVPEINHCLIHSEPSKDN